MMQNSFGGNSLDLQKIKILDPVYEGKGKKLYACSDPQLLFMEFKDDLTAFNAQKKGSFQGKGQLGMKISNAVFSKLAESGVPTHLVGSIEGKGNFVKKVKMIPLEVVIRNRLAGSTAKKFGIQDGTSLSKPLFELFLKNDALGDPFISTEQVEALNIYPVEKLSEIKELAFKVNQVIKAVFVRANLDLIDFKIEFGETTSGEIILADEISPDSCRLWDISAGTEKGSVPKRLDKDVFRMDLGSVDEAYAEVWKRLQALAKG